MQVLLASPWLPAEWVRAHGLVPRGIWNLPPPQSCPAPAGAGLCAFADSVVRRAEATTATDGAVIFTTHCDQLRRGFDALPFRPERHFLFNLPVTTGTPAAEALLAAEFQRLGRFLVRLGGHAPTLPELEEWVRRYENARQTLREAALWCPARPYAAAVDRFLRDGSVRLPRPPSEPPRPGKGRVALLGGPMRRSQWPVLEALERSGARVALNATENGERALTPMPAALGVEPGAMHQALARCCLARIVDVFQRPNTRCYEWLREHIAARRIEGLLLWHYINCDLWRAEVQTLREKFGLPVLAIEVDETPGGLARSLGRVEAFVEGL